MSNLSRDPRTLLTKHARPLRFLAAGTVNTIFGLALYPLLLWSFPWLRTHYLIGLAIAQPICICFAFAVYKLGVFRTRANLVAEFVKFLSYQLTNVALNWFCLPILVELAGLSPVIGQIGFVVVFTIGGYFWHSRITFNSGEEDKTK